LQLAKKRHHVWQSPPQADYRRTNSKAYPALALPAGVLRDTYAAEFITAFTHLLLIRQPSENTGASSKYLHDSENYGHIAASSLVRDTQSLAKSFGKKV